MDNENSLPPEVTGESASEGSRELSPEEQEISSGLRTLAENEMAIKTLADGSSGGFFTDGIGFTLLKNDGQELQDAQLQIEGPDGSTYNFGSWRNNFDGLAKKLVESGLTTGQLNTYVEHVQSATSSLEEKDNS
ncbi:MAG: hypothetical protein HQ538_02520 [Parcubacteria group bacterium]|nr:hypothetical protein [Parcubacteria group bacterium]